MPSSSVTLCSSISCEIFCSPHPLPTAVTLANLLVSVAVFALAAEKLTLPRTASEALFSLSLFRKAHAATYHMDERQPLLAAEAAARRVEAGERLDIVEFDPHGDAENPQDWSNRYKWCVVALLAFMAFTVTFTCISMVPVAGRVVSDLGDPSRAAAVLLVTIWELGESAGPLIIAPLSEVYGRYPVINVCNAGFIAATVLAALCGDAPLFVAARALTGLAVASNVLNPAVVGDLFPPDSRGAAMSLIQFAPLTGGAVGPLIAGAVAQTLGWRSVLWMSALLACVCELFFLTCFRETYSIPILRRKAARLRVETGNPNLRTAFDLLGHDPQSLRRIWETMARPVVVFCKTPVLQAMSLFGALVFSFFYVLSTTMPDILQGQYQLSPAATGLCFIVFSKSHPRATPPNRGPGVR